MVITKGDVSLNQCNFVGWITNDLEMREGNNTKYLRFQVAVRRNNGKDGQKYDYVPIVAFGKTAEFINQYFNKGDYIHLNTKFRISKYTGSDGNVRYSHDFVVTEAGFCSPVSRSNQQGQATQQPMQRPTQQGQQAPAVQPGGTNRDSYQQYFDYGPPASDFDIEVPF